MGFYRDDGKEAGNYDEERQSPELRTVAWIATIQAKSHRFLGVIVIYVVKENVADRTGCMGLLQILQTYSSMLGSCMYTHKTKTTTLITP